jgi:putative ABC transport system permease protein
MDDVVMTMRSMRGLRPGQPNNFEAVTQERYLEVFNSSTAMVRILMFALSSVGLMVGGVGVVAIMMISVTERTREIGVRKALGARRSEILVQFLLEAAFLTLAGGVLGILLGTAVGVAVHFVSGFPVSLPWWSFALGLGFSASVGIFFGMFPAFRASRMDPIEALRYE